MKYLSVITLIAAISMPQMSVAETNSPSLTKANAEAAASASSSSSQRTGSWVTLSSLLQLNQPINKTTYGQPNEKGEAFAVIDIPMSREAWLNGQKLAFADISSNVSINQAAAKLLMDDTSARANSFFSKRTDTKRPKLFETHKSAKVYTAVPNKKTLDGLSKGTGDAQWACLTEALYFEARGESIPGIFAVAEVIANRKASKKFPDSICGVIAQGSHRKNACQFSYKCDGHEEVYREAKAKELVAKIAQIVLEDRAPKLTSGATFYHANSVSPRWSRVFRKTATIGKHFFYRG